MCSAAISPKALSSMQMVVRPNDCNLAQGRHAEQGPHGKARCELASTARFLGPLNNSQLGLVAFMGLVWDSGRDGGWALGPYC